MIPYLGQKSNFYNFIVPNIPTDISVYSEPFGGGFSIFFCLDMEKYRDTQFIYNDINKFNAELFHQLKDDNFVDKISDIVVDESKFYQIQKNLYSNNWTSFEVAVNWLILLCCSSNRYDITNSEFGNDSEFEIIKVKLKYRKNHFDRIVVNNCDYKEIIEKYDSESTFFYLDPPYKSFEHYYINHNFTDESHEELSKILRGIKGKFALSYYYFSEIEKWYDWCRIIKNQTMIRSEYLIMNY